MRERRGVRRVVEDMEEQMADVELVAEVMVEVAMEEEAVAGELYFSNL